MKKVRELSCIYCKEAHIHTTHKWFQTYICDACYEKKNHPDGRKE